MGKTSYYSFRLTRLFPPDDEYATTMARICILWEDLLTEATGGAAQSIQEMDGHSVQWRRLYFLRRSIGTLHEIRKALHHLRTQNEFKQGLSRQPQPDQDRFIKCYETLLEHEKTIKDLRNSIAGGHVEHTAIKEALHRMHSDETGVYQQGEHYKDIRLKFTHPIVLAALFKNHGGADAEKYIDDFKIFMHAVLHNAIGMIEIATAVYVKERGITPL